MHIVALVANGSLKGHATRLQTILMQIRSANHRLALLTDLELGQTCLNFEIFAILFLSRISKIKASVRLSRDDRNVNSKYAIWTRSSKCV